MTTHYYINMWNSELLSLGNFRVVKVIHITVNMGARYLPHMYALSPWLQANISGKPFCLSCNYCM